MLAQAAIIRYLWIVASLFAFASSITFNSESPVDSSTSSYQSPFDCSNGVRIPERGNGRVCVKYDDFEYAEGMGGHSIVYAFDEDYQSLRDIEVSKRLGLVQEEYFPDPDTIRFWRVHKSYLINRSRIIAFYTPKDFKDDPVLDEERKRQRVGRSNVGYFLMLTGAIIPLCDKGKPFVDKYKAGGFSSKNTSAFSSSLYLLRKFNSNPVSRLLEMIVQGLFL